MKYFNSILLAVALVFSIASLSASPASAGVSVVFDQLDPNQPQVLTFQEGPFNGQYFAFSGEGWLDIGAPPGSLQYMLVQNVDSSGAFVGTEGTSDVHSSSSFFYLPGTHHVEIILENEGDPMISVGFVAPSVPESSTWAMMILGFFGLGWLAYRRSTSAVITA